MDLHPLTVHFPIAFLCLYSVMELARLPVLTRQSFWFPIKAVLLIVGVVGAFVSLQTGEGAAEAMRGNADVQVLRMHANFATAATWIYAALTAAYILTWLDRSTSKVRSLPGGTFLVRLAEWIAVSPLSIVFAVTGLLLLTVVGALGASMVYGPGIDPAVGVIYHLLIR